jgi:phosphoribosyl 1,2-cyclic phosphodiesterase
MKPRTIEKLFDSKVPVYCSDGVKKAMRTKINQRTSLRIFPAKLFRIGSLKVKPFKVNHDSIGGCVGYCLFAKSGKLTKKITLATDFGNPGKRVKQHLHNSHGLLLTSDHDTKMLDRSYEVPEFVKADHIIPYHLSNDQCANLLVRAIQSSRIKPTFVYLLHISDKFNTVQKALAKSRQRLHKAGYNKIKVLPSYSYKPSRISQLGVRPD